MSGRSAADGLRTRPGPHARHVLLAVAAAAPVVLVLTAALGAALLQSLGLMPFAGAPELTVRAWTDSAGELVRATGLSLYVATASTVLSVVVGFLIAAYVLAAPRAGRIVGVLSVATVPVPHLIAAGAMGLLLSDAGFLARLLGMPAGFPSFVGGPWWTAAVLEFAWKESAFVALVVLGSISRSVGELCEAAASLGATARQRMLRVVLPLSLPSLAVSAVIVFVYTLGSYEAVWLLGPTSPEPLPVRAVRLFGAIDLDSRPRAMATALVSVGVGAVAVVVGLLALRRIRGLR